MSGAKSICCQHAGFKVKTQSAVFFGNAYPQQAELTGFVECILHKTFFHIVHPIKIGDNLCLQKVIASLRYHFMLFTPFFWNENFGWTSFANEKFTSAYRFFLFS